jgi:hypothetical protein
MSNLYASINADTSRTLATRRGRRRISAHARGWDEGVEVELQADQEGKVMVEVWRTGGSNEDRPRELVCSWVQGVEAVEVHTPKAAIGAAIRKAVGARS